MTNQGANGRAGHHLVELGPLDEAHVPSARRRPTNRPDVVGHNEQLTLARQGPQSLNVTIGLRILQVFQLLTGLLTVAGLTGCVHLPGGANTSDVCELQAALTSLSPTPSEVEAMRVARCAYDYSEILAGQYRVARPAIFHNFLVNTGFKQRGLCYEWAEDLLAQLQTLSLESLELHWGIARANTAREHNSVVITARGQPFEDGIVLDPWRRSGRLVWSPVTTDQYPWVEGELTSSTAAVAP